MQHRRLLYGRCAALLTLCDRIGNSSLVSWAGRHWAVQPSWRYATPSLLSMFAVRALARMDGSGEMFRAVLTEAKPGRGYYFLADSRISAARRARPPAEG